MILFLPLSPRFIMIIFYDVTISYDDEPLFILFYAERFMREPFIDIYDYAYRL
jgi:hypothetical protein